MRTLVPMLMFCTSAAFGSGPVEPDGWSGSFEPRLPNGAACCLPADLNGTGLVGGAMVLIADDKTEFALFALTYTRPLREHWQLLERHPMKLLAGHQFSVGLRSAKHPFGCIKSCLGNVCNKYFSKGSGATFVVSAD